MIEFIMFLVWVFTDKFSRVVTITVAKDSYNMSQQEEVRIKNIGQQMFPNDKILVFREGEPGIKIFYNKK